MTTSLPDEGGPEPADQHVRARVRGEPRWPMATAVLVSVALQLSLPDRHVLSPTVLFPTVEVLLLVLLVIGDPGRIDRRPPVLRRLTLALVIVMTLDNLAGVAELVGGILDGSDRDNGPVLLATGGALWVTNVIAFSLWFWLLDRGGPAARAAATPLAPAFAFPENATPELAPPDWWPQYVDYLYLAFTNSTALSPTDTMPLTRWAKMLMLVQSSVSLVIAVMIVARAVNILNL
jgi:uncharacterized membrane protein